MDKTEKVEIEVGLFIVIAIAVVIIAWPNIAALLSGAVAPYSGYLSYWYGFVAIAKDFFGFLVLISIPFSFFFFFGIIYCVRRLNAIRHKEYLLHEAKVEPAFEPESAGDRKLSEQWNDIKKRVASDNESDWKQAIVEADILLDDILTKMGYRGESVGEKLQRVAKGDMQTLDDAWAAHKVRNDIAHTAGFSLNQREASHTVNLYKKVFEEFYYI